MITPSGTSALSSADRYTFVAVPAPDVTALSASTGTTAGGTLVTITGHRFTGAQDVLFGNVSAASFVVLNDTQIAAVAPAQAAGAFDVTVLTPTGSSAVSSADLFTYTAAAAPTVSALAISTGTTAGGAVVTITGTGLASTTGVSFGAVAALDFTVLSDTTLVATAPPQAAGTVDVTVTTFSATSATSGADHFVVTAASAPAVTAVSPGTGSALGGDAVTITGSGFLGATGISFGTTPADFSVLSDTAILAYAPARLAGTVDITVTTFVGTSSTSSADQFVYSAASAPTVSALSTSTGSTKGGAQVVLTGSGFSTASSVNFGDVAVSGFVVNSDTQLTVLAPAQFAGTVDVTVANGAGTSAAVSAGRFSYTAASAPAVTGLSTSSGGTGGGTSVVIAGTDLLDAFAIKFGDVYADFVVNSDTSITATAPSQAAGTVDVTVTTFAGSSASASADHFTFNSAGAPTVTALATAAGSSAGGTLVTLTGTALLGTTAVSFGGVSASFVVESDTSIGAVAPPQAAGTFHVTVTTPTGTSSTSSADQFVYSAASAPAITLVTPNAGSTLGGAVVTVVGSAFTGASSVLFGTVPASSFTVNSDNSITAIAPPQASGFVDVRVVTPSGTSATGMADQFTVSNVTAPAPAVTGLDVTTGSTAGGRTVTITGTNFSGATAVHFGFSSATFAIVSDTTLVATTPFGFMAGLIDVTVTTNNGTSATGSADQFTYLSAAAPTVTGLGTATGNTEGGTSVAIVGTGFTGSTSVTFGGVAASFTVNSSTSITATSPAQGAGIVDVVVTTPSGLSAVSSNDHFTYSNAPLPAVANLSASTGPSGGGTAVTITGTDFLGAFAVTFGDVPAASFTVVSSTSITATAPADTVGPTDVRVSTYSGRSATSSTTRFTFTAASTAAVSSLSAGTGSTAGGTAVTIAGTGFSGASRVRFGSVDAAFTVVSSTSITATAPAQTAGTVDVTVTTPTGTSPSTSSDQFVYSAASAPTVSGLGTSTGGSGGGTSVALTGSNFTSALSVTFGGVAASFTVESATSITAIAPPQAAGTVHVTVTTAGGTSSTSSSDQFVYTAATAPSVTGVAASSGSSVGGALVTITGSNFTGASAVSFGGAAALSFSVVSDTAILATAPAGAVGTVDVTVTTPSATSSTGSADHFTYNAVTAPTITALGATSGTTAGGTSVTLTGTGFLSAVGVSFGGASAASFVVLSDTSISAITPSLPAGSVDVTVSVPGASSALVAADRFKYVAASAPAVTGLGTSTGSTAGGTAVTIAGTGFTGAAGVAFGGAAASFVVNSDTSISATAPSQAAGLVDVVVSTPTGTSATSSSDHFAYTAQSAPTLTALSLTSGSSAGGAVVNLTGTGFVGTTGVSFGTAAASFTVESDTWIIATAPAQAAGAVSVTVTTPGGTSGGATYTYSAATAPSVTGLTPSSGSTAGGTSVTVLGAHFTSASDVKFGTTSAASFQVLSDTAILALAPAGTAGTIDVTVLTPSGTSATSSADHFTWSAASAPTVTAVSPSSGSTGGGAVVVLAGTNFTTSTGVNFGSYAASFTVDSATQITAVAPSQAAGTIDVTVVTAAGTSATSSADHFAYSAASAPVVTGVTPAGPLAGNNAVAITGSGFLGATGVSFGTGAAVSFTVLSDVALFAVAPAGSAGTVDVAVTTPSGTSATGSADLYAFQSAPTASSVSPSTDTTSGGAPVTITGTNLTGALAVYFGNVAATTFTVESPTSLTVTVPAQAAGTVNLTVVTPGGTTAPLTFAVTTARTVTWVGGTTGSWGTTSNWSIGALPTSSDDVVIGAGVTVTHSSGTDTIHQLTANGALVLSGGTLSINAVSSIAALTVSGGNLDGTGAVTVSGSLTWSSGYLQGSGSLTIPAGVTATLGAAMSSLNLTARTVNNAGTANWASGGGLVLTSAAVWNNLAGGLFVAQTGFALQMVTGSGTFNNAGTFRKTGSGPATIEAGVTFTNTGTIDVQAGTLELDSGSGSGTVTIASGATLKLAGFSLSSTSSIAGAGSVEFVTGGTSTLGGTISASGGVTIDSGVTVVAPGGTTIGTNLTNNGALTVGGSGTAGALTITGNYVQSFSGALNVEIGGLTAGSQFDQLRISGSATLAGTLAVSYLGGFTPSTGNSFALLTYGSHSGTFSSITGTAMTAHYNSGNFSLLAMWEPMVEEDDPLSPGPSQKEALAQRARPSERPTYVEPVAVEEAAATTFVVFAAEVEPGRPALAPGDEVFRELSEGGEGVAGWEASGQAWDDLLTLPLALLEEVLDVV